MNRGASISILFFVFSMGYGCDDDATGLYRSDSIYLDPATGLEWQALGSGHNFVLNWNEATGQCENLALQGKTEWRLPNVNELMTLLRGCDQAACGLDDPDCLGDVCGADCTACTDEDGAGAYPCYLDGQVGGDCGAYWTSSVNTDHESEAWAVDFESGVPAASDTNALWYVRCVRSDD